MEEMRNKIAVLREISSTALQNRDAAVLMSKVLEILHRDMGMIRGYFTLRKGSDLLEIEASFGMSDAEKKRGRYHFGEGIIGRVAESRQALLVRDISKDSRFLNRTGSFKAGEHIAFLCVPVVHREQVIGTLSIDRHVTSEVNLENDLQFLEVIGGLTAEAIDALKLDHEEREELIAENQRLRDALNDTDNPGQLVGRCRSIRQVYSLIRKVAPTDATVLIRGSSGTGKELVANAIRQLSTRADRPFVTLNCAALPENLVESELFGHEKGAFTGALSRRIGRAEAADGGTLFLDEIGDLSLPSQVKLLRFIQEKSFSRIGSNEELHSDVRIIAATSRNLEQLMAEGKFREDLYYRLNIFPIMLPDLCRRRCDILLLAEHFIAKHNLRHGTRVTRLSTPAINMLMAYHWPGNVRELENCIERAVLTANGDCIHGYDLPPTLQTGKEQVSEGDKASFETMVNSFERELIVEALKRNNGNMSAAARELELSPRVIHYKINHLGITPEWYKVH